MDSDTERQAGRQNRLKIAAIAALIIQSADLVWKLIALLQTRHELSSPLIPEATVWQINKGVFFHVLIAAATLIAGMLLYFNRKRLLAIVIIVFVMVADRFIYL